MGLTLANALTILRMVTIPFFIVAIGYNRNGWALVLFVAAGLTDLLDGLIARVWKGESSIGAVLDPLADKLLLTAALVMLAFPDQSKAFPELVLVNRMPIWVIIITISRDVFISIICLVIYMTVGQARFPPSIPGKITTAMQLITVSVFLLGNYLGWELGLVGAVLMWAMLGITIAPGFHYIYLATRLSNQEA